MESQLGVGAALHLKIVKCDTTGNLMVVTIRYLLFVSTGYSKCERSAALCLEDVSGSIPRFSGG